MACSTTECRSLAVVRTLFASMWHSSVHRCSMGHSFPTSHTQPHLSRATAAAFRPRRVALLRPLAGCSPQSVASMANYCSVALFLQPQDDRGRWGHHSSRSSRNNPVWTHSVRHPTPSPSVGPVQRDRARCTAAQLHEALCATHVSVNAIVSLRYSEAWASHGVTTPLSQRRTHGCAYVADPFLARVKW